MREYGASSIIKASPKVIWEILTDASGFPEWDPDTDRIEGTIDAGEKIKAYSKRNPDRAFQIEITEFEPGKRMVWSARMPLGLFKGERTFTLAEQDEGAVEFKVREQFSGPLLFLLSSQIPDFDAIFAESAAGLKERAESVSGGAEEGVAESAEAGHEE